MKRLLLVAGIMTQVAMASGPADYAVVIPIETSGDSAAWQFDLDAQVYSGSVDENLRDIAVFNAGGHAVPIMIEPVKLPDSLVEQRTTVPILPLPPTRQGDDRSDLSLIVERDAAGRLRRLETQALDQQFSSNENREWLIDLDAFKHGIDTLDLDWDEPRDGVIARFEVSGSDDLQRWKLLNAGATLVMLDNGSTRVEQQSIRFSTTRTRYLRLRRSDDGTPIVGLHATATKARHVANISPVRWIDAQPMDRIGELEASSTQHLYLLPYSLPVSAARVALRDNNSVAQLEVLTAATSDRDPIPWARRARLVGFRLLDGDDEIQADSIQLSHGQPRIKVMRIESGTPLASHPGVQAGFRPARLIFLAEGSGPYLLAAGSATARTPAYPVEAALASLRTRLGSDWQPPSARLGDLQVSAGGQALLHPEPPGNWKNWLLWGVLVGAALTVAGIALSLLRGTGQRGTEDRQQPPEE